MPTSPLPRLPPAPSRPLTSPRRWPPSISIVCQSSGSERPLPRPHRRPPSSPTRSVPPSPPHLRTLVPGSTPSPPHLRTLVPGSTPSPPLDPCPGWIHASAPTERRRLDPPFGRLTKRLCFGLTSPSDLASSALAVVAGQLRRWSSHRTALLRAHHIGSGLLYSRLYSRNCLTA